MPLRHTTDTIGYSGSMPPITILRATVGYGLPAFDNGLGYDSLPVTNVFGFRHTLSAHAASVIDIDTSSPLRLRGFLNGTASCCHGARFSADGEYLGSVYRSYDTTHERLINPGFHTLAIKPIGSCHSCHTVWGLTLVDDTLSTPREGVAIATVDPDITDLDNWLRYHFDLGVSLAILCFSSDPPDILNDCISSDCAKKVTVLNMLRRDDNATSTDSADVLRHIGASFRWLTILHTSECITLKSTLLLPSFLSGYSDYGGLVVPRWQCPDLKALCGQEEPRHILAALTLNRTLRYCLQPQFVDCVTANHELSFMPDRAVVGEHCDEQHSSIHIQVTAFPPRATNTLSLCLRSETSLASDDSSILLSRALSPSDIADQSTSRNADDCRLLGFIHVAAVNHWESILRNQMSKAVESGLYDRVDRILIGVVGASRSVEAQLKDLPSKVTIGYLSENLHEYEFPTLQLLQEACIREDCLVWYVHSKGVVNNHTGQQAWRNRMEAFTLIHHDQAIERLSRETYVGAAVFGSISPRPHVPGNFWWAQSRHIRTLPPVQSLNHRDRYEAEWWVGALGIDKFYFHDYGDIVNPAFTIVKQMAGAGQVTTNGSHSWNRQQIITPSDVRTDVCISAHAPSRLEVHVHGRIVVSGFVCPTSIIRGWRLAFIVDGRGLGEVSTVGQRTEWVVLDGGNHTFEVQVMSGDRWGAHSVWSVCILEYGNDSLPKE